MIAIDRFFDTSGIDVAVGPFVSIPDVETLWRDLEPRSAGSFFLSWTWIGAWLKTSGVRPSVLTAHSAGRLVGLGLLNGVRRHRLGLRWPALSLHETGAAKQDCIMIEDNGFLAERGREQAVTAVFLGHLAEALPSWRELRLGGVPESVAELARDLDLPVRIEAERPSLFIDLAAMSNDGAIGTLSANTRQQIGRSMRLYRERGPLAVTRSNDIDDAAGRFAEMAALHQRRWTARGKRGAFAEPFFGRFHHALLERGFTAGKVDVLRVAAGVSTIGLLYTFFHNGEAYAYQNGFSVETDARLKPGLVSHVLAAQYCRQSGLDRYGLLAGDSRYKRSLSTGSYELYWLSVRRPDLAFRVEQVARRIAGREA